MKLTRKWTIRLATICGAMWLLAADAAETQKYWLAPDSLPAWAQTGQYRCSRWDGGPLEAEKGKLSGWPLWEEGDAEGILSAVGKFYDFKSIAWAKRAGLNWVWVTWSVGFSHETERAQWDMLRPYIAECHKQGLHVTAYISGANMFHADMAKHVPESTNWWELGKDGKPVAYSAASYNKYGVTRYMANIHHPQWLPYQRVRVREALQAGADGFWVDNIGSGKHEQGINELVELIMTEGKAVGKVPVVCFNMHRGSLAVARCMNALSTEDGVEPGYFADQPKAAAKTKNDFSAHESDTAAESAGLVCNIGLLKYQRAVSEGWRASAIEYGRRHNGASRLTDIMPPETWQLALAECQSHQSSLEPYFEGVLMRDLTRGEARAQACVDAMGEYNKFFGNQAAYLAHPRSLARAAIFSETKSKAVELKVISFLTQLSACQAQCDVVLDLDQPALEQYDVLILPEKAQVNDTWKNALAAWTAKGGKIIKWNETDKQANKMAERLREAITRATVTLQAPPFVLMHPVRQEAEKRTIVHVLNYQKKACSGVELRITGKAKQATVLSPDSAGPATLTSTSANNQTVFQLPPVKIYSLVVVPDP